MALTPRGHVHLLEVGQEGPILRELAPIIMYGGLWQKGYGSKWMFSHQLMLPNFDIHPPNTPLALG